MTIESCYSLLASNIRALRRSRGLDQRAVADHLGFARVSSISDLEHGRVRLQVHQLLQLAELFEVPVTALLFGASEKVAGKSEVKDQEWKEYAK